MLIMEIVSVSLLNIVYVITSTLCGKDMWQLIFWGQFGAQLFRQTV